jgi:methyl-accepting chemotaxis protein
MRSFGNPSATLEYYSARSVSRGAAFLIAVQGTNAMSSNALNERLDFIKLGPDAQKKLQGVKSVIMKELPGALDAFYDQIRAFPETRKFFAGESQISGAQNKQVAHWETISSGQFDQNYVRAVTAVGEVHARIGLEPRWYIGGYALVLETLISKVLEARWPKGGFGAKGPPVSQVAGELGAVTKATLLDMDYAISVYLEVLETARQKADLERGALEDEQNRVVAALADSLSRLAKGDLTARIDVEFDGRHQKLKDDFNAAIDSLRDAMSAISSSTESVGSGAEEISSASDDLSRRTEQQAASLEETAAAFDQITATVQRSAEGAKQASQVASSAKADAQHSGVVVREAVAAMGEIEGSSKQITQIIGVIDEIAFQTNLLALNAGVEAARAGDAGRGFAVVAQEVRALAQRSAEAAKEIKALISSSTAQVSKGVKLVDETGEALVGIGAKVTEIDGLISEIALSSQEQAIGLSQVNAAVNQMDQVTQQNAAMVEEATAAASSLKSEAQELAHHVGKFQLGGEARRQARPEPAVAGRHAPARNPVAQQQSKLKKAVGGGSVGGWEEF